MSKKLNRLLIKLLKSESSGPEPVVPSLEYLKENILVGNAMTRDVPIYEDDYLKLQITTTITRKK